MTTIITALFDIGREKNGDGRTVQEYLNWFDKTLKLNTPMVIFTEQKFKEFILNRRGEHNTKIIIQELDEIPYFVYKQQIEGILLSKTYKDKIKDANRIECNLYLYNIIQYSKFEWIKLAIDKNIFNSDYYFWMDAGCSRFFDTGDLSQNWPQNYKLINNEKLLIQGNINTRKYLYNWPGDSEYILDSNCILVGTLFGGYKTTCLKIADLVKQYFEKYLNENIINNEQIILGILLKKYPELFNVYIELNERHLPLFKKLYEN